MSIHEMIGGAKNVACNAAHHNVCTEIAPGGDLLYVNWKFSNRWAANALFKNALQSALDI
jgi:hypothetical protein